MSDFNNTNNDQGHELDWDDVITKESSEFTLLQPGKYPFEVKSYTRMQYNGSQKQGGLPPCKACELEIIVRDPSNGDEVLIKHRLYLHSRTEGLISQFFVSIGLKKHGEPLKMEWNKVPGATGICNVFIESWKTQDGEERKSNKIKSFCDPAKGTIASTAPSAPSSNGSFGGFGTWN